MRRLMLLGATAIATAAAVAAPWLIPAISTAAQHAGAPAAGRHAAVPAAARPVNYCQVIPIVNVPPEGWGFRAGHPVSGATGAYARGHGTINLSARTATGVICQVRRSRGTADRQVVLTVGRHVIHTSHHAVRFGVPGNIMSIHLSVHSSTDPACTVATKGRATIFASYNNVHRDSVRFTFAGSCRDQQRRWTGPSVVTNVPPN